MTGQLSLIRDKIPANLIEYGICTESSDYRVHVAFQVGNVFVFPTKNGCRAVQKAEEIGITPRYVQDPAVKDGQGPTARGIEVPPVLIDDCQEIAIPPDLMRAHWRPVGVSTSDKGRAAQDITFEMFRQGLIRLPLIPSVVTDDVMQRKGQDMLVTRDAAIQIKCDYFAGYERRNGTIKHLFLQTHERNPLKQF